MDSFARASTMSRKDPPTKIVGRRIRINPTSDQGTTSWPFPFDRTDKDSPAWKARYAPHTLTKADAMELAEIANCYSTMITHPASSLRATIHVIHRAWKRWRLEVEVETEE